MKSVKRAQGKIADEARRHWKKFRPKMFSELQKTNQLEPILARLQERLSERMTDHIVNGLQVHEAWELIAPEIYLPTEEEQPEIGEDEEAE